jgi:hypothetical protein
MEKGPKHSPRALLLGVEISQSLQQVQALQFLDLQKVLSNQERYPLYNQRLSM